MKYLKKFSTHSDYATFTGGTDFILPNVSYCVNEDEVHYNPYEITHEYVDFGLPSGTLWATENIKDANGNMLYFAWGETQGYTSGQVGTDKNFSWEDYEFGTEYNLSKYTETDGKTVLEPEDDAATANWGSNWRMPTYEEFEELMNYGPYTWDSSRSGYSFTDGNDNELLFLFAGGLCYDGDAAEIGEFGYYWTSSLSGDWSGVVESEAMNNSFGGEGYFAGRPRYIGCPVLPVRASN